MTSLQEQRCTAQPPVGSGTRMCPMTSLQEQRCTRAERAPEGPGTRTCPVTSCQPALAGRRSASPFSVVLRRQPSWGHPAARFYFAVGPGLTSCQPALAGRRSASPFSVVLRRQPSWGHPAAEFYFAVGPGLTSCQPALAGRRSASPFSASAPERIRTSGLSLRRRPLYPAELRGRRLVAPSARQSTALPSLSGMTGGHPWAISEATLRGRMPTTRF